MNYCYYTTKACMLAACMLALISTPLSAREKKKDNDPAQYRKEMLMTPLDGSGTLYILNYKGDTILKKKADDAVTNFQRWIVDGQIRYTYFLRDTNAYVVQSIKNITGWYVIADSALNEIKRIEPIRSSFKEADKKLALDCHDFILLSDDHYIADIYYDKHVNNIPDSLKPAAGMKVLVSALQEVKNGKVIFTWESTDYPELYGNSVIENHYDDTAKVQDYLHVNSVVIDPKDNNLVLSCRNADQVIKINRKTGKIMWRLGGNTSDFPMPDSNTRFFQQHNASFTDDGETLMIFDNGFASTRPYTRVDEYKLDEKHKKIVSFKTFKLPKQFSPFAGSVQKFGDFYLISGGNAPYIQEINYKTGEITFERKLSGGTYRILKY